MRWWTICAGVWLGVLLTTTARADDDSRKPTADPPPADPTHETVVVAATPLHGSLLPSDRVAANIQTATGESIDAHHNLDLSEYMNESLGSVTINQVTRTTTSTSPST